MSIAANLLRPNRSEITEIAELQRIGARDPGQLAQLFAAGSAPEPLDGRTDGAFLRFTAAPLADRAAAALSRVWMPWLGKRFDAARGCGVNLLDRRSKLPLRLIWPSYSLDDTADGAAGFEFRTQIEPSVVYPHTRVLAIDYRPVESNPRFIVRSIRDELVTVGPGIHLGQMAWMRGGGRGPAVLAYFALRSQRP